MRTIVQNRDGKFELLTGSRVASKVNVAHVEEHDDTIGERWIAVCHELTGPHLKAVSFTSERNAIHLYVEALNIFMARMKGEENDCTLAISASA